MLSCGKRSMKRDLYYRITTENKSKFTQAFPDINFTTKSYLCKEHISISNEEAPMVDAAGPSGLKQQHSIINIFSFFLKSIAPSTSQMSEDQSPFKKMPKTDISSLQNWKIF